MTTTNSRYSAWQDIGSAPSDRIVKLGGWFPSEGYYGQRRLVADAPEWCEFYGIAFANMGTHRQRVCDKYFTYWQPFDTPPPPSTTLEGEA